MCGRYQFTVEKNSEILHIIHDIERRYGADAWCPGEICPTAVAPILLSNSEGVHAELQSWGYPTSDSLVINARAETAESKPMFRDSMKNRRCVVPSTGFFEWDKNKQKFFFAMPDERVLYMAGLYDIQMGKRCYCILTTEANKSVEAVHHRMPLVLCKEQIVPWLNDTKTATNILHLQPPPLKKTNIEAQLRLW